LRFGARAQGRWSATSDAAHASPPAPSCTRPSPRQPCSKVQLKPLRWSTPDGGPPLAPAPSQPLSAQSSGSALQLGPSRPPSTASEVVAAAAAASAAAAATAGAGADALADATPFVQPPAAAAAAGSDTAAAPPALDDAAAAAPPLAAQASGLGPAGSGGAAAPGKGGRPAVEELLLILKWGGVLTHAGRRQAEDLGRTFRLVMYPRWAVGGQGAP
jgi:hypothetical protein